MRIVFFGASEIGWECCRWLIESGYTVAGIFSIPPEFRISWSKTPVQNVRFKDFEQLAKQHNIPFSYVTTKMSDPLVSDQIRALKPDLLLVIGWYYMVPKSIRDLAPQGALGVHASLLPRYRGGAPLVWAMINGEKETGVSLFYLEEGTDEGDVVGQQSFPIAFEEDISSVIPKAQACALDLLKEHMPSLAKGKGARHPQNAAAATLVPQRSPEDGRIQWQKQSALEVYNWVRAQTRPYPGAFTFANDKKIIIWKCSLGTEAADAFPGKIIALPSGSIGWAICCADNRYVVIEEVGLPNGQTLSGEEFRKTQPVGPLKQVRIS